MTTNGSVKQFTFSFVYIQYSIEDMEIITLSDRHEEVGSDKWEEVTRFGAQIDCKVRVERFKLSLIKRYVLISS